MSGNLSLQDGTLGDAQVAVIIERLWLDRGRVRGFMARPSEIGLFSGLFTHGGQVRQIRSSPFTDETELIVIEVKPTGQDRDGRG